MDSFAQGGARHRWVAVCSMRTNRLKLRITTRPLHQERLRVLFRFGCDRARIDEV